jgi:tetratricopeptide (TPR) repeat protein
MYLKYIHRSALLLITLGLILLAIHFPVLASEIKQLTGDRITVFYPSIMPEVSATMILRNEERALPYVESFLNVRYQGTVQVHITDCLFSRGYAEFGRINYCLPFDLLQKTTLLTRLFPNEATSEITTHEMVHVVAMQVFQNWRYEPPLNEGLATAIDSLSAPTRNIDLQLLAKGLLRVGKLAPLLQVLTDFEESDLYSYQESGSFIQFLNQRYGIERFKAFFALATVQGNLSQQDLAQVFRRVYGMDLSIVEDQWHQFLESYALGMERRAECIAQTRVLPDAASLYNLLLTLEGVYQQDLEGSPQLIGPLPEGVFTQMIAAQDTYLSLERDLVVDPEQIYRSYKERREALKAALERWWSAVSAFSYARGLMMRLAPYASAISELQEAQALYQSVGDEVMAARVNDYATAYQLLSEGEKQLGMGEDEQARSLLWKAWSLFRKLNEPELAHQVRILLMIT